MTIAGYCLAVGALIPVWLLCLAGSYMLVGAMIDRASKTVLGTHIRHVFVRLAPAKRFDPTDTELVEAVIVDALKRRGSKIRSMLIDGRRD